MDGFVDVTKPKDRPVLEERKLRQQKEILDNAFLIGVYGKQAIFGDRRYKHRFYRLRKTAAYDYTVRGLSLSEELNYQYAKYYATSSYVEKPHIPEHVRRGIGAKRTSIMEPWQTDALILVGFPNIDEIL